MSLAEGRVRVVSYLDEDVVRALDDFATQLEISRSKAIEACIDSGLEDVRFLSQLGLTPRRMLSVGKKLKKMGIIRIGEKKIDLKDVAARMEIRE